MTTVLQVRLFLVHKHTQTRMCAYTRLNYRLRTDVLSPAKYLIIGKLEVLLASNVTFYGIRQDVSIAILSPSYLVRLFL